MDLSFTQHLDQLIERLKSELVQHYEKDVASIKVTVPAEAAEAPHILRLTAGSKSLLGDWRARSPKSLLNRRTIPMDSDGSSDELEEAVNPSKPSIVHHRLPSKSAVSDDSEASDELKTPKHGPSKVQPAPPLEPLRPVTPAAAPKMLLPAKVAPTMSEMSCQTEAVTSLQIPHQPMSSRSEDSASDASSHLPSARQLSVNSAHSARIDSSGHYNVNGINSARGALNSARSSNQDSRRNTKDTAKSSQRTSTSSSSSSASFASSSDENAPKAIPAFPNSRLQMKRPSNASVSLFFKREAAVSRVWLFLQDPDSSNAAWYYDSIMNYFIAATIIFTIWQAAVEPPVPRFAEGVAQIAIEGLLLVEFIVHWCSCSAKLAFWKNPYNILDLLAILPLGFRIAYGIATPTVEHNLVVHSLLYCFVPVVRQLKLIRKFQKLQLLLHVLSTTLDALKLLLFLVCLIVLFFGCILYVLEPAQSNQSLAESIYLCTVTVTTVGTCDMAPITWPGKILAGVLCLISVLFMAMPLSVLGNAMSNTWADRHRILLMTQTRRKLKNLGYTAEDMPKLFKKFDKDGNGDLEMEEFCDLVATMRVGIKPSEASELFMAFDANGDGGISEMEFMKALFPLDYRRIYRRMSGMTFGA